MASKRVPTYNHCGRPWRKPTTVCDACRCAKCKRLKMMCQCKDGEAVNYIQEGERGAVMSDNRVYRYSLWRRWSNDDGRLCCFIGLNPSTADEKADDPTIRRCVSFAKRFGCVGLVMANLFAFRATKPSDMLAAKDRIGPDNDTALRQIAFVCHPVVCCWGSLGNTDHRGFAVKSMLRKKTTLYHLGLTKGGHPKHPLYLKADTDLVKWS